MSDFIRRRLLKWVLKTRDTSAFVALFRDCPDLVLSVTQVPYGGMLVRFVDGREIDIPDLPASVMDGLSGFERDRAERWPTWVNMLSIVRLNADIETGARATLQRMAERLGVEIRDRHSAS